MNNQSPPSESIGKEINGPGKTFFDNVVIDNVLDALLELTAMVWTYRDRSIVIEKVLQDVIGKDRGIDLSAMIEAHQPSPEELQVRMAEREELVAHVFRNFSRRA